MKRMAVKLIGLALLHQMAQIHDADPVRNRHGYMILENGTFLWKDLQGQEKMRYCEA